MCSCSLLHLKPILLMRILKSTCSYTVALSSRSCGIGLLKENNLKGETHKELPKEAHVIKTTTKKLKTRSMKLRILTT
jgi:hypothetical protein